MKVRNALLSSYIELTQAIKPEFIGSKPYLNYKDLTYILALKNGVPISYLNSVNDEDANVSKLLFKHTQHYKNMFKTIKIIANLLDKNNIPYVVMKTIRPYPEDTYDIDILILDNVEVYKKSIKQLLYHGFNLKSYGPYNIDLISPNGFDVDVYFDINANRLIYIHKKYLIDKVTKIYVDEMEVPVFNNVAELLLLILHGIIKENITLGTLLTTIYFVHSYTINDIEELTSLTYKTSSSRFIILFMLLLRSYLKLFYNYHEPNIDEILKRYVSKEKIGYVIDPIRIPPYNLNRYLFAKMILSKIRDPFFRISLVRQVLSLPFIRSVERERVIKHIFKLAGI